MGRRIADLPTEMLREIFGHVDTRHMPAVARVCRLWRACVVSEWGAGATIDGIDPAEYAAVCAHTGPLWRLCSACDRGLWTDRVAALSLLVGQADAAERLCDQNGPPTCPDSLNRIAVAVGLLVGGIAQVTRLRDVGYPWGDGVGACAAVALSPREVVGLLDVVDDSLEVRCAFVVASALDRVDVLEALCESRWRSAVETCQKDCLCVAGPVAGLEMAKRIETLQPHRRRRTKNDGTRHLTRWIVRRRTSFVADPGTCLVGALFRVKVVPSSTATLGHPKDLAKALVVGRPSACCPFPSPDETERRSCLRIAQRRLHGR
ncbi:F-box incomplete domain containing protein [Pandoravirus neocaledonia]|uniref:F-box incomplete domain containing protein n=1 Tax=Pandoravirus neocaledonia TaxID=2107708 RepID=A0A2U7UD30_9VIRU|nr:F-box incomplete domain containing protein [Pandoravirus neocaledonia]AVK76354.1 F-box incomplete domain containing protein [Pandoravirus neocaledonia]